jgi:DNA-binding transcriptional regulator YiaG
MEKKYQSEILMVCHQDAEALRRIGAITDEEMAEYDRDCLVQGSEPAKEAPVTAEPEHIGAATV